LKGAPNDRAPEPTEPNFDRDGQLLIEAIEGVMNGYAGRYDDCVIALDAPLEAQCRPRQPRRKKAVPKGHRMFTERRACENALSGYMSANPENSSWNQDLKIQPGSPIAPRIARICTPLSVNRDFAMFRPGSRHVARHACTISASRRQPGQVDKGKGYDDPIESGIAFLTALMFIRGEHHVWGDGSGGTIVGPGWMPAGA